MKEFPEGFYWGAATASYQVEGGIENNDWAHSAREGKVPLCGIACDQYNRYEADFDLAKELGHNAHRFSIEWSRIEPEQGKFDLNAIEHYRKVLQALRARRIEPFVTIWHWTMPIWFVQKGGWMHREAEKDFLRYVNLVVTEFHDLVKFWVVYNEPETPVRHGYLIGDRPPHHRMQIFSALKIIKKIADVYAASYRAIKVVDPQSAGGLQ
jgi:beta-glucosidase